MIFSPAWISGRLTSAKEVGVEVPVENPALPVRLSFDDIHLSVSRKQLILTVERPEDLLLERCRDVAVKVLTELPHTPLQGVGVNYHFIAQEPDTALFGIFTLNDNDDLSDAGITIKSTIIQRSLLVNDQVVNLSLTLSSDQKVHLGFNFHKDTQTTIQALEFLRAHSTDLKAKAFEILSRVYKSKVEPLEGNI